MLTRMQRLGNIIVESIDEEYVAGMVGTVTTNHHSPDEDMGAVERGTVLTANHSPVVGKDVGDKCSTRPNLNGGIVTI